MSFFDTTPLGRILNRFSSDIEVIDNELGSAMAQVFSSLMNVIGALIAIVAATNGLFAPVAIPIILVYYYFSKYYRKTSTELKRLESVSKSPIFALFSEALTGASTIRAYDQGACQDFFFFFTFFTFFANDVIGASELNLRNF